MCAGLLGVEIPGTGILDVEMLGVEMLGAEIFSTKALGAENLGAQILGIRCAYRARKQAGESGGTCSFWVSCAWLTHMAQPTGTLWLVTS